MFALGLASFKLSWEFKDLQAVAKCVLDPLVSLQVTAWGEKAQCDCHGGNGLDEYWNLKDHPVPAILM